MKTICVLCFFFAAAPVQAGCNPPPGAIVTVDAVYSATQINDALKANRENLKLLRDGIKQHLGYVNLLLFTKSRLEEPGQPFSLSINVCIGCSGSEYPRAIFSANVEDVGEIIAQILERKIESQEQQLCALGVRP